MNKGGQDPGIAPDCGGACAGTCEGCSNEPSSRVLDSTTAALQWAQTVATAKQGLSEFWRQAVISDTYLRATMEHYPRFPDLLSDKTREGGIQELIVFTPPVAEGGLVGKALVDFQAQQGQAASYWMATQLRMAWWQGETPTIEATDAPCDDGFVGCTAEDCISRSCDDTLSDDVVITIDPPRGDKAGQARRKYLVGGDDGVEKGEDWTDFNNDLHSLFVSEEDRKAVHNAGIRLEDSVAQRADAKCVSDVRSCICGVTFKSTTYSIPGGIPPSPSKGSKQVQVTVHIEVKLEGTCKEGGH